MFWRKQPSAVKGLAAGALGGLIASWIMGYAHTAFDKAAETVSKPNQSAKAPASDEEQANVKAAVAVAHAVGTLLGAGYGVAAEYSALPRAGVGTAFGAALWLVSDEVAVPALHLAKATAGIRSGSPSVRSRRPPRLRRYDRVDSARTARGFQMK